MQPRARRLPRGRWFLPGSTASSGRVAFSFSLLLGQHGNAASEAREVTRLAAAAAVVESEDVFDEMPDDVPRVVSRDGVVTVALTGVPEARAARGPPGHVEGAQLGHRDDPAAGSAERPEGRNEDVEHPRV